MRAAIPINRVPPLVMSIVIVLALPGCLSLGSGSTGAKGTSILFLSSAHRMARLGPVFSACRDAEDGAFFQPAKVASTWFPHAWHRSHFANTLVPLAVPRRDTKTVHHARRESPYIPPDLCSFHV